MWPLRDIFILCWSLLIIPVINGVHIGEFAEDYYFGEMRASDKKDGYACKDVSALKQCNDRCGSLLGICYEEECYCVVKYNSEKATQSDPRFSNFKLMMTRRHHIAHFCPNLEVARACIRKCMTEGKPAFCGKDHVCYCSHSYNSRDKKDKTNATAVRNAFYDLYEKYFGPQYAELDPTSPKPDTDHLGYKKKPDENGDSKEDAIEATNTDENKTDENDQAKHVESNESAHEKKENKSDETPKDEDAEENHDENKKNEEEAAEPEAAAPEEAAPEEAAPEEAAPEEVAPEETAPEEAAPEAAVPEE